MQFRQPFGQPNNAQAGIGEQGQRQPDVLTSELAIDWAVERQYDYQNGYIQAGHVVPYPSASVPTSMGVPPAINYPQDAMNVYQQSGQQYPYPAQEHAYAPKPIFADGQLATPSFPFSSAASPAGNAISPVDVFGSSPTPYTISPGLGPLAIGTPMSTPSLVQTSYSDHSQTDYFGRSVADAPMGPPVAGGPSEMPNSDREPSPGSKKKRGRPKSESLQVEDRKDNKEFDRPRLPHNEVERKYRESLNLGFEKLRATVPTLPKYDSGAASVAQKQSKAAVLGAAIEYIKYLEGENERLVEENKRLKMNANPSDFGGSEGSKRGNGRRR